jgi:hypothetical protein
MSTIEFPIKTKLHRFYKIIELALEKKQPIIVGTSDHTVRAIELEQRFPNAHIEIVEIGVKVCPK